MLMHWTPSPPHRRGLQSSSRDQCSSEPETEAQPGEHGALSGRYLQRSKTEGPVGPVTCMERRIVWLVEKKTPSRVSLNASKTPQTSTWWQKGLAWLKHWSPKKKEREGISDIKKSASLEKPWNYLSMPLVLQSQLTGGQAERQPPKGNGGTESRTGSLVGGEGRCGRGAESQVSGNRWCQRPAEGLVGGDG